MSKDEPIKFRERQEDLVGRRNGMQFWIRKEPGLPDSCVPAYWVTIDPGRDGCRISTIGREYFHLDEAMEFCRRIAAGEIDLAELRAAYEAQDEADFQYTQSVIDKVRSWLEERAWPDTISAGGKNYPIVYRKAKG